MLDVSEEQQRAQVAVGAERAGERVGRVAKALGRSLNLLLVKCKPFEGFSRRSGTP